MYHNRNLVNVEIFTFHLLLASLMHSGSSVLSGCATECGCPSTVYPGHGFYRLITIMQIFYIIFSFEDTLKFPAQSFDLGTAQFATT